VDETPEPGEDDSTPTRPAVSTEPVDAGDGDRPAAIDRQLGATRVGPAAEWRARAALVAIAQLAAVAVVAIRGPDDGRGGVEVVETGFSELSDDLAEVSYGVVVENNSDEVAYHTTVCVRLLVAGEDGEGCREFTVEVLQPGQRVGFGSIASTSPAGATVTGVDAAIDGTAAWDDPADYASVDREGDYDDPYLPWEVVADELAVVYSPENEPVVSFNAEPRFGNAPVRNASAYAVFRDADGEILGASGAPLDLRLAQPTRLSVVHDAELPDVASAEVYVFPSGL
jgi:hypothetical protein